MVKAIIDLDDVMIPLNYTIAKKHNLDINNYTDYNTSKCRFSDIEKAIIFKCYRDVEIFKAAGFSNEALKAIRLLEEIYHIYDLDIHISSLSLTTEIAEYKHELLDKYMDFIPKKNIVLGVIGGEVDGKKRIETCDIIIEDCINNIYNAESYKYAFLIDKPYNRVELQDNIIRQNNVYEAVTSLKSMIENNII